MKHHERVREQLILWMLGEPTDQPVAQLADHLAHCPDCVRYLHTMEEAIGRLPEALPRVEPPPLVRERVLAYALAHPVQGDENGSTAQANAALRDRSLNAHASALGKVSRPERPTSEEAVRPRSDRRRPRWWSGFLRPLGVGSLAVLLVANVLLQGRVADRSAELTALAEKYAADVQWLRTAERLLVEEQSPHARGTLVASADSATPIGSALLYYAYDDTAYLLLRVEGVEEAGRYEVWWAGDEQEAMLSTLEVPESGEAIMVHRGNNMSQTGVVSVRRADSGEIVLAGSVQGSFAPYGAREP